MTKVIDASTLTVERAEMTVAAVRVAGRALTIALWNQLPEVPLLALGDDADLRGFVNHCPRACEYADHWAEHKHAIGQHDGRVIRTTLDIGYQRDVADTNGQRLKALEQQEETLRQQAWERTRRTGEATHDGWERLAKCRDQLDVIRRGQRENVEHLERLCALDERLTQLYIAC